jgi:hypothetical protein
MLMRKMAALAAVCAVLVGCTLANLTPQERFKESTHVLNDASRWGRVDIASEQVSPKYRDRFVSRHREWGTTLSIADADITRMQLADDRQSAISEISVSWYETGGITLRSSVITQKWEVEHGKFFLVDEAVRVGDPKVFVEDAPTEGGEQSTETGSRG